jgi:3-methyladenine DNA glycosylase AlkD
MEVEDVVKKLKVLSNPEAVKGMVRFGINPHNTFGISIPNLKKIAREIGKDHKLTLKLWQTGIHEARILTGFIDDHRQVTEEQMGKWVSDFDSWDVCDQVCSYLFDKTPYSFSKAYEWSKKKEEFIKRAGFVLMACLAVHEKKAPDEKLEAFLPIIKREAADERNYVKKAINWALRQIGKRNLYLNVKAIELAEEIQEINSKSARWIASDALRELKSEAVQKRLALK